MHYKLILFFFVIILCSCVTEPSKKQIIDEAKRIPFESKGFTLIYNDQLYKNKKIKGKIESRSLIIFQKNLKKNTTVRITNLINSKYIVAKVGNNAEYPNFFNSVISERISTELEISKIEPYIEIKEFLATSSFVAKKAKTFDEEKKVATKVPVDDIKIKDLSNDTSKKIKKNINAFNYIVKIGDFYFKKSADEMKSRILSETTIEKVHIGKLSKTKFRVFLGPYSDLNSLKNSFNAINVLQFESIEIIKK